MWRQRQKPHLDCWQLRPPIKALVGKPSSSALPGHLQYGNSEGDRSMVLEGTLTSVQREREIPPPEVANVPAGNPQQLLLPVLLPCSQFSTLKAICVECVQVCCRQIFSAGATFDTLNLRLFVLTDLILKAALDCTSSSLPWSRK